jgi:nitrite reductase (NADH) small subunit
MTVATLPSLVRLCPLDEIPVGLGRSFRVGGKLIAVFRSRSGRVFAVDGVCPHKGGPLADGMLAGEHVVCPLHAFRFHAAEGACDQPGVCGVATYPVEVVDGTVCLTAPQ